MLNNKIEDNADVSDSDESVYSGLEDEEDSDPEVKNIPSDSEDKDTLNRTENGDSSDNDGELNVCHIFN